MAKKKKSEKIVLDQAEPFDEEKYQKTKERLIPLQEPRVSEAARLRASISAVKNAGREHGTKRD